MNYIPETLKEQSSHLQRLITKGENLEEKLRKLESQEEQSSEESPTFEYNTWFQRVINALNLLLPAIQQESTLEDIKNLPVTSESVANIRGKMRGIYLDIEGGNLNHFVHTIQKEGIEDLLSQADELLIDGGNEIKGYILAGMCISITLEHAVRKLSEREGIITENDEWKSLGYLIDGLKDKELFTEHQLDELMRWKDIRNDVAHGEFDDFTSSDIQGMIEGVKRFVKDYL